jgi:hypothetical protein
MPRRLGQRQRGRRASSAATYPASNRTSASPNAVRLPASSPQSVRLSREGSSPSFFMQAQTRATPMRFATKAIS